jgi:hypothetical protein
MANLEHRVAKAEQLIKKRRKRGSTPKNDVFILPGDEKRYQAFLQYAKKHPNQQEWVAIILPAKKQIR